ncbi:MAG TPA: hypothetical protein VGC54_04665 [Planctomycetota bacterium]
MQRIGLVGISHRRADAAEIAHFSRATPEDAWLQALRARLSVDELVYLATCNRVFALWASATPRAGESVRAAFADFFLGTEDAAARQALGAACFTLAGEDAVKHLFSVASGLDSLVLGDGQITGQFRRALTRAREAGTCTRQLSLVCDEALVTARRVREAAGFRERPTSVAEVAAQALREHARGADRVRIVLVGAGEMIRKVAPRLAGWSRAELLFVNRSAQAAAELAAAHGGSHAELAAFRAAPPDFDLLVAGTAAPAPVLHAADFAGLGVPERPRLLLDLGLPPDIDPGLGERPGFVRLDVLELGQRAAGAQREAELLRRKVRPLLERGLERCRRRLFENDLGPAAARLRGALGARIDSELARWLAGPLAHLSGEDRDTLRLLADRLAVQTAQVPLAGMREVLRGCTCGGAVQAAVRSATRSGHAPSGACAAEHRAAQ